VVTAAVVAAMMGSVGVGAASANASGSAEQVGGIYFAGHASGSLTRASGGFEAWDYDGNEPLFDYISGKVDCYAEPSAGKAVFSATITKGDLRGPITFWLDTTTNPDRLGYTVGRSGCPVNQENMKNIESGGSITVK